MKTIKLTLLFFFLTIFSFSQSQRPYGEFSNSATKKTEKKLLKAARKEFDYGNYPGAAEKYSELLKIDSTNPLYNFEQGQTFYNDLKQPRAISYYEKAIRYSSDTLGEVYYFLANAYHLSGDFNAAKKMYATYLSILNIYGTELLEDEEDELKLDVKRKIEMCENGIMLQKSPQDKITINGKTRSFRISSVSKDVNSEYDDYDAVLTSNDSLMYFTARRKETTGGKMDWDDKYFEDILVSGLGKKGWGQSFGIGSPINSKKHEAIISVSADGKTIYFYRGVKQGTFFYSKLVGNAWTKPEVLYEKSDINTSAWETSFFGFTIAGDELYVVSDREGGFGGRDIFVAKKQTDGQWGTLVNAGAPINTPYNEDSPFITPDGKTMFFSSAGHNSMGGFDIFRSERQNGKWTDPVNLGMPFNTPGDDIYFITANKSDRAYFSSSAFSTDGTRDMDIYLIDLCDDVPETILNGLAKGISTGTITVTDKSNGQNMGEFKIEKEKYSMRLLHGKDYRFTLNASAIEPVSIDVAVPQLCKVYDLYQELNFPQAGQPLVVKNAFFDIKNEAAIADIRNYSEFLIKMDKSAMPFYSETSVPTSAILAKVDTAVTTTGTTTAGTTTTGTTTTGTTTTGTTTTGTTTTGTTTTGTTTTGTTTTGTTTTGTTTTGTTTTGTTTTGTTTTGTTTTGTTTTTTTTSSVTTISVNNILFDYDKSSLKSDYTAELDKVVDFLKNANKKAKIQVSGHTDSKGSDTYNLALSNHRVNAVAAYLISKGISKSRIKIAGYGESKPVASNENPDGSDNPDGRAKNRRTEIGVVQ